MSGHPDFNALAGVCKDEIHYKIQATNQQFFGKMVTEQIAIHRDESRTGPRDKYAQRKSAMIGAQRRLRAYQQDEFKDAMNKDEDDLSPQEHELKRDVATYEDLLLENCSYFPELMHQLTKIGVQMASMMRKTTPTISIIKPDIHSLCCDIVCVSARCIFHNIEEYFEAMRSNEEWFYNRHVKGAINSNVIRPQISRHYPDIFQQIDDRTAVERAIAECGADVREVARDCGAAPDGEGGRMETSHQDEVRCIGTQELTGDNLDLMSHFSH